MVLDPNLRRPRRSPLIRWHRWLGLVSAVIVIVVAVTGVLINHARSLNLRQISVDAPFIMERYGLVPDQAPVSYLVQGTWITWLDGSLFVNTTLVAEQVSKAVGAASSGSVIAAATPDQILLITFDGELIERLPSHALPGNVSAITGADDGGVIIETNNGIFASNGEFLRWTSTDVEAIWTETQSLPAGLYQGILQEFGGAGVSLGRILLDIHAGRFFGAWMSYVFDIAAIALLFLAISGVINSVRPPGPRGRNRNGRP